MIKLVFFLVAIGVAALGVLLICRRGNKEAKLTDKRAKAEVLKQLLALSDEGVQSSTGASGDKNILKTSRIQPPPVAAITRQQRRAEQRRAKKLAFAKSQRV